MATWGEGRAMPLKQAIAYALEEPSPGRPPETGGS
jgi:hypothetical protein